ncbi:hypothetical protein ACFFOV_16250 [Cerasicoccus arenae]
MLALACSSLTAVPHASESIIMPPEYPVRKDFYTVDIIVSDSSRLTYGERYRLAALLPDSLSCGDVERLLLFVEKTDSLSLIGAPQLIALKNEALNALGSQEHLPEQLAPTLASIYRNSSQNSLLRDYAIQHMIANYDRVNPEGKMMISELLLNATNKPEGTIGGTAILGLMRLSQRYPAVFSEAEIVKCSRIMTINSETPLASRITAIQVYGSLRPEEFAGWLGQEFDILPSDLLRVSSLGVLGLHGSKSARSIVQKATGSPTDFIASAAATAQNRLSKRGQW